MAKKNFILQGLTLKTHKQSVRQLFDMPDIKKVTVAVAFVSESGVQQIEELLRLHAARVTVYAGIRNDITSYQGLVLLHDIGVNLYTVDTGSRSIVFHPKLYLVRGKANARLVVGSANLTLGGMHNNIEAGLLIDFNLAAAEDKAVVDEIEAQLKTLPDDYPEHVVKVANVANLGELLASGRLVDEMAVPPPHPGTSATGTSGGDTIPRISLKVPPLRRALSNRAAPKKHSPAIGAGAEPSGKPASIPAPAATGVELDLVWASKPLTERDLNVPSGSNTHRTGSINLDKGLLPEAVDHRHYFRSDVFRYLAWGPKSASDKIEEASARFHLVLKSISYGEFDLRIRHSTSTVSKTYTQKNAMTRLSWGPMRESVARNDLIGRTLALYRDNVDPGRFVLAID